KDWQESVSHLNPVNSLKTRRIFREVQDRFFSAEQFALIAMNAEPFPYGVVRSVAGSLVDFGSGFRTTACSLTSWVRTMVFQFNLLDIGECRPTMKSVALDAK